MNKSFILRLPDELLNDIKLISSVNNRSINKQIIHMLKIQLKTCEICDKNCNFFGKAETVGIKGIE